MSTQQRPGGRGRGRGSSSRSGVHEGNGRGRAGRGRGTIPDVESKGTELELITVVELGSKGAYSPPPSADADTEVIQL